MDAGWHEGQAGSLESYALYILHVPTERVADCSQAGTVASKTLP